MPENMLIISSFRIVLSSVTVLTWIPFYYVYRNRAERKYLSKNDDETVGWSDGFGNDCHNADANSAVNSLYVHAKTLTIILL